MRSQIFSHPAVNIAQPHIYAFWHGKFFLPIMVVARFSNKKIAGLVSHSKDGEILATWIRRLGLEVVRGSSSKKGARGIVELIEYAKNGYSIGIAADGPRGPIFCAKSGAAYLAQKTGMPILPIGAAYRGAKQFQSWDRFFLPMPFSKGLIYLNEPIYVNPEDNIEAATHELELKLHAADTKASLMLQGKPTLDIEPLYQITISKREIKTSLFSKKDPLICSN